MDSQLAILFLTIVVAMLLGWNWSAQE